MLQVNTKKTKIVLPEFTLVKSMLDGPKIIVPKKVAPKSVDRNRIRRIFKEALKKSGNSNLGVKIIVAKNLSEFKTQQISALLVKPLKNYV